jgi:hypothetical protein
MLAIAVARGMLRKCSELRSRSVHHRANANPVESNNNRDDNSKSKDPEKEKH